MRGFGNFWRDKRVYPEEPLKGDKERIELAAEKAFDLLNSDKRRA
jgi:hypothetical protein